MKTINKYALSAGALLTVGVGHGLCAYLNVPGFLFCAYFLLYLSPLSIAFKVRNQVFFQRVIVPVMVGVATISMYKYLYSLADVRAYFAVESGGIDYLYWFYSFISVLYAIITAFLLWKGLSDHDVLRHALNDEASKIRNILNYTMYFDQEGCRNEGQVALIRESFAAYAANVLRRDRSSARKDNEQLLHEIVEATSHVDTEDENDHIALEEIMKQLSELYEIRSKRRNYLVIGMSPYLLLAIVIMSLAVVFSMFSFSPIDGGALIYTMIFIMATLLAFMFMTMLDISSPYTGFWHINTQEMESIVTELGQGTGSHAA